MSEDLGVAFGVVVADHWCRHLGATTSVNVVDVDVALNEGLRWFEPNGTRLTVGDRQPDYLLVFADPDNQRQFTYKALECKGSVSRANVRRQLARAVTQLGSLEVGGRSPQGIAVATVNDHIGLHYFAVDPPAGGATDGRDGDVVEIADDDLERARRPSEGIRTPRGTVEIAAAELVARSLFATAGGLADYAGNYDAAAAFLPPPLWERLARNRRERSTRETANGAFRGLEYQFSGPGGSPLSVFMGVADIVDDALATANVHELVAAQMRFVEGRTQRQQDDSAVSATSNDGAILMLESG